MSNNKLLEQYGDVNQLFNNKFNAVTKILSYNAKWTAVKPLGSMAPMVDDPDFRLILMPGEWAKVVDPRGRHMLALGTVFGLIVIYEMRPLSSILNQKSALYSYVTTQSIVDAGLLSEKYVDESFAAVKRVLSENFEAEVRRAQVEYELAGKPVNDGMERRSVVRKSMPSGRPMKQRHPRPAPVQATA